MSFKEIFVIKLKVYSTIAVNKLEWNFRVLKISKTVKIFWCVSG